jgi:hypothetical protein
MAGMMGGAENHVKVFFVLDARKSLFHRPACRKGEPDMIAELATARALDALNPLGRGSHTPGHDVCVMEAVAYVAGEPWSDHPQCACPVITSFLIAWNDGLADDERDALLRPLVPRIVGTRSTATVEHRRALMAVDWLVRDHAPAWLRLAGLTAQADALAALHEITDVAQVRSIRGPIEDARHAAGAAAGDADAAACAAADTDTDAAWADWAAAWGGTDAAAGAAAGAAADAAWADWADARDAADSARAAAWVAAAAARDSARAAAWAARDARDAAGAAVRAAADAARDSAMAAVRAVLNPTRLALQQSALRLVERMIAITDGDAR